MAFKSMSMTGAGALAAPKRVVAAKAAAPACVRASVEAARKSARPRRGCRSPPLVSLSLVAGVAALSLALPAFAEDVNGPAIVSNQKDNARVQLIYEARDLELDQKPRSDKASRFAFQKLSVADTRARAGESLDRISTNVKPYSDKKYWTQAANELRRQLGTLRFDLDNLVAAKGAGATEVDSLVKSLEKLDFAFRLKDPAKASAAYATVAANTAAVKSVVF